MNCLMKDNIVKLQNYCTSWLGYHPIIISYFNKIINASLEFISLLMLYHNFNDAKKKVENYELSLFNFNTIDRIILRFYNMYLLFFHI